MRSEGTHLVIGGGVVGLCSAYFLAKAGHEVTVIKRDPSGRECCSKRNAGMIVPSHFVPLAAPGVVWQGIKWMFNRRGPFHLRPRLDPGLWSWCWRFWRHSNRRHVENSKELLRDLSLKSRSLFEQLAAELDFALTKRGLLMLCRSEAGLQEEVEVAEMAREIGIPAEVCGPERLRELEPEVEMNAIGGVWFPQDCHLDSEQFLAALRRGIERLGGQFRVGAITGFRVHQAKVTHAITASGEEWAADRFTIAGGAWSSALAGQLGMRLPMQAGKGYSFTLPKPAHLPRLCSLLKEGRVAVTPMGNNLRVAGTMEICGNDLSIDRFRLEGMVDSFCRFFPQFHADDFKDLEPWSGLRPCSPDGLPYIGPAAGFANVTIATGHAMLGLSLGPVTGKLVADLAEGAPAPPRLDPRRYQRERSSVAR